MAIAFCPNPLVELVPSSGSVPGFSTQNVVARVYSCCLPSADDGQFTITSNDTGTPTLAVPVSIVVSTTPPAAVDDLVLYWESGGMRLRWSATNLATGYHVYRMATALQPHTAGERLTPTPITETNFLDTTALDISTRWFYYQVVAVR
jgi:hypothetical protein